jgi:hypothetical protein
MKNKLFASHRVENVLCIDEERLEVDVFYRFHFLAQFYDFSLDEIKLIQDYADELEKMLPIVFLGVNQKLVSFDSTRKLLLGRVAGVADDDMFTDPETITLDSPNIKIREKHFCFAFMSLFRSNWDEAYISGPLAIGISYKWGNKYIDIPVVNNDAANTRCQLMFTQEILKLNLELDIKHRLLVAVNKAVSIYGELSNMALLNEIILPEMPAQEVASEETSSPTAEDNREYLY